MELQKSGETFFGKKIFPYFAVQRLVFNSSLERRYSAVGHKKTSRARHKAGARKVLGKGSGKPFCLKRFSRFISAVDLSSAF